MIRSKTAFAAVIAGSLLASACAVSQPAPSAGDQIVSSITVEQAQQDEQLALLKAEAGVPESKDGAPLVVRWGGTIAEVVNRADGTTMVEIVSRPLYGGGRPIHDDRSDGRFLAQVSEFLDPQIIEAGRDMTVVGTLAGRMEGNIGESVYVFPVVAVQDYRYWKQAVVMRPNHFPHWNYYPSMDPLWRDWPFNPDKRPRRTAPAL